jgi:ABC-type uncharacterized transport system permease subunit
MRVVPLSPSIVPPIIYAVGVVKLWSRLSLLDTYTGVIIVHVVLALPLVMLAVSAPLSNLDQRLMQAARSLGARALREFTAVILPHIARGIAAGALLAFVIWWGEITVTLYMTGRAAVTLLRRIWSSIAGVDPALAAIATVMLLITISLDPMLRESMQREFMRLHSKTGVTFVCVTHDQEEAIALSDHIAIFNLGRIVETGPPRALYKNPSTRFVAGSLGGHLMSCRLSDEDSAVVEGFGSHFDLPREGRHAYQCGETLTPWVRPEDIRIGPATADEVGCVATVVETLFVGALERLVLRTGGGEQLVATPHSDAMIGAAPGQALSCRIKASAIGLLPNESRTS